MKSGCSKQDEECLRVLHTGLTSNHGGVESFVLNYAKTLKKNSVTFDYVDLQGNGLAEASWILSEGSEIHTMKDYRRYPLLALKRMKEIVENGNYTCVHVNMLSAASLVPAVGAMMGGARVLVHSHNSQTIGIHRKVLHWFNRTILGCLPVTRLACGNMAGDWMFGRKRYEVIPNAIDTELFRFRIDNRERLRFELNIGMDTVVLGFVGRISPQKNPVYLVNILNALRLSGLENIKLLIIGDGELREQVMKKAEDLGIAEDIIFSGSQKNVNEWYSAMDVLLLPSLWEGLPLVGVEAQAAGLPCFLSDQITEEIAMTDLVHFCKLTETADNWAEAILNSRVENKDRCAYADVMSQTNYSIDRSSARLYEIYCSVGGEGKE